MTEKTKDTMPKTFDEAMLEFQKLKVQASKGSKNPHFKSQYASLEDVMRACDEGNQFGLVYSQPLDLIEIGGQVLQVVVTKVTHVPSGETRQSPCPIRSKDPNDPQKMGSGITYAKRYALQAFYGLCSDDDGNLAATPKKEDLAARTYTDPNTGQVADVSDDYPEISAEDTKKINDFIKALHKLNPRSTYEEITNITHDKELKRLGDLIVENQMETTGQYEVFTTLSREWGAVAKKLQQGNEYRDAKFGS